MLLFGTWKLLGTHALHFMAYFQGEHLGRGSFLDVCLVNKGERLLFGVSPYLRLLVGVSP